MSAIRMADIVPHTTALRVTEEGAAPASAPALPATPPNGPATTSPSNAPTAAPAPAPAPAPAQDVALPVKLEKLSYKTVDTIIRNVYNYKETTGSTALDILAVYLKGQKVLYTESKTFCEKQLNALMLPAIFMSALSTVLSLVLQHYDFGATIVSSINALTAFVLAVVNYLKLDAKAEAHKTSAYKFDKLQSYCEFNSGKYLFNIVGNTSIIGVIEEIEKQVKEIKETNQFVMPESVRHRYPLLYSRNVFATVKILQNEEMVLINRLKTVINETLDIMALPETPERKKEIQEKSNDQTRIINQIIAFRSKYLGIDKEFDDEIRAYITRTNRCRACCSCDILKT